MAETLLRTNERHLSPASLKGNKLSAIDRKRKRTATPSKEMQGPKLTDKPRLSTPEPRTPRLQSSVGTDTFSLVSAQTAETVLTIPDEKEEEDGIVKDVGVLNPFVRTRRSDAVVLDEFAGSSVFADEPDTGRNEACEVLEATEFTYSQTVLSQQVRQLDEPEAKRRKTDATRPVLRESVEHVDDTTEETEDEDDPDYETNSNWDRLEEVQDRLKEYNTFKKTIKGYNKWTPGQAKLHKLLALRGCWPMFQHSWALNFSIRNIYPSVFAPDDSDERTRHKRVAISCKMNEFRATRALEAIFDLSAYVASYRQSRKEDKISGVIKRALKHYIGWAAYDAGVEDRVYVPTLQVYEFDPRRWAARVSKRAPSTAVEIKTEPTSDLWDSEDDDLDSDPISDEVERRLHRLAARHRGELVMPECRHLPESAWTYVEPPPLLFAFVIVQHMVMIVSLDSSDPKGEIVVFSELDMSLADQWLWNALAIALPVNMARDTLWERRERLPVVERVDVDDDPDL